VAEMTRPCVQPVPGALTAGRGHQHRPPSLTSEISLAAVVTAIGCARTHATSTLNAWSLGGLSDDAELVTSELVTNAVRATGLTSPEPRWADLGHLRPSGGVRSAVIRRCCGVYATG
jgi:hypothetical protein